MKQANNLLKGQIDMPQSTYAFVKSSYCGGGSCVEVAPLADGTIAIRDAKDTTQQPLFFTQEEWKAFVRGVKAGEFDL